LYIFTPVAQLVELRSPKPSVAGSSPAWRAIFSILLKRGLRSMKFLRECVGELKKVVWPTKQDVLSSVWVVICSVCVMSIILGAFDYLYTTLLRLVF
jgi:preprotein translocase subunit SecE